MSLFSFPEKCDFDLAVEKIEATPVPRSRSLCQHLADPYPDVDRCSVPPISTRHVESPLQQGPIGIGTGGGEDLPLGTMLTAEPTDYFYMFEWDPDIVGDAVFTIHHDPGAGAARRQDQAGLWDDASITTLVQHIHADNFVEDNTNNDGPEQTYENNPNGACHQANQPVPGENVNIGLNVGQNFLVHPALLIDPEQPPGRLRWIECLFASPPCVLGRIRLLVFEGELLDSPAGPTGTLIGRSAFLSPSAGTVRFNITEDLQL